MDLNHPKIAVMGIGGIGGLISGPLLRRYGETVSLIARGERAESLRRNGLTLNTDIYGSFTVKPAVVTDDPSTLPVQDIVLVCVKNGGLEKAAAQLAPIVDEHTLVLPIMNGVTAGGRLKKTLNKGVILQSVIYTVSFTKPDFSVLQMGAFTTIHVGAVDPAQEDAAEQICTVLKEAGIDIRHAPDVTAAIWSKYVLNCAYNVMTARHACNIGAIKASEQMRSNYYTLMEEAMKVGAAKGVNFPQDILQKHMKRLDSTTDDSTSSLSRDFDEGRTGEMEVFAGDVIRMGEECGVATPLTREYYQGLLDRAAGFGK